MSDYRAFLEEKVIAAPSVGFEVPLDELHPWLAPHAKAIVQWGLRGGRRAFFTAYGLHKTSMQLECGRQVLRRHGGRGLIVIPLGVRQEFWADAEKLEIGELPFIRRTEEAPEQGLCLTNYESVREGKVDPSAFSFASLDEADVLRSYGSKTFQSFLPLFEDVPYRFVATATPDPNRHKELIHYAGFLGVMDTGQALTRFFQRNSEKAGDLTLYPHKETEFWLWVHSWAIFLQRPSDLGFSDDGYQLPDFVVRWHEVKADLSDAGADRDGQMRLMRDAAAGVVEASREKRATLDVRISKLVELRQAEPENHFILWHDLEDERRAIERVLPAAVAVYGSQDIEEREAAILGFKAGVITDLAAKPMQLGAGPNFQAHCHRAIYAGIGFKYRDFIQSLHRIQRFGQKHQVEIDIIYAETERDVRRGLEEKWARDLEQREVMSRIIREFGLDQVGAQASLTRTIGIERQETSGEGWCAVNNDCIDETRELPADSLDLVITSVPFSNHYEYTPSYRDFGHTDDDAHFFRQMDFLTPELLRALKPGRIAAVHVKDRILFGAVTGLGRPTVNPFHAKTIFHFQQHGFGYLGCHVVLTDVVRENNQTYRLGYSEMMKDATKMGAGSPEWVLLFCKPQTDLTRGYADQPVTKGDGYSLARWQVDADAFWRSSGDRLLSIDELAALKPDVLPKAFTEQAARSTYDHEAHVAVGEGLLARGALPKTYAALNPGSWSPEIWHDVTRMLTLNGEQSAKGREKHVCLARGSRILTRERGYIPIEDVQVGEHALTHMGRWQPVEVVACTGTRPVITVRAQGVPGLTVTPDHNLWARKSDWVRERDGAKRADPAWIEAQSMLGGYVNFTLPPVDSDATPGDSLTWWVIGRWLADGHFGTRGDIHISCGRHEIDGLRQKLGELAGPSRELATATQLRVRTRGTPLLDILDRCGAGAGGKHLPPEAFTLDHARATELLHGYLSGDGHFLEDRQRWMASSVSRDLLLGMAMLAQRVYGAIATVFAGRGERQGKIEGRTVSCRQDWIMSFDLPGARRRSPFILADGAWKKVRALEDAGEAETWCLRVAEDASFTAEGCIVKNCPLQFDIVDRLIRLYSEPGELVYDPFAGLMTVPYRALRLKRRGLGVELHAGYWRDGARYLEAAEREFAIPSLMDLLEVAPPMRQACEAAE